LTEEIFADKNSFRQGLRKEVLVFQGELKWK
jgi:hypothetical protein